MNIDDHITGRYDTENPNSPYFQGTTEQDPEYCEFCHEQGNLKTIYDLNGNPHRVCDCINSEDCAGDFVIFGEDVYILSEYVDVFADTARSELARIIQSLTKDVEPGTDIQPLPNGIMIYKWGATVIVWDRENKLEITSTSFSIEGDVDSLIKNLKS